MNERRDWMCPAVPEGPTGHVGADGDDDPERPVTATPRHDALVPERPYLTEMQVLQAISEWLP